MDLLTSGSAHDREEKAMDFGNDDPRAGLPAVPTEHRSHGSDDDEPKPSGFINEGEGIPLEEDETVTSQSTASQ